MREILLPDAVHVSRAVVFVRSPDGINGRDSRRAFRRACKAHAIDATNDAVDAVPGEWVAFSVAGATVEMERAFYDCGVYLPFILRVAYVSRAVPFRSAGAGEAKPRPKNTSFTAVLPITPMAK